MDSISVVIPLYNKAPHIARALDSVLARTSPAEEIVVIDDGSIDGGGEIVKSFNDPRIRLERQENQGVSAARNRGIEIAKGELIAFLDADDEWKPNYLATIRQLRDRYPNAGAYATAYQVIKPDGSCSRYTFKDLIDGKSEGLINNIFKMGIPDIFFTSSVVIPRSVLEEFGGFEVGDRKSQDTDLWIKIGIKHPFAWNREHLSVYYQNASNRVHLVSKYQKEPAFCRTVREALRLGIVPADKVKDLREYAAYPQLIVVRDLIIMGQKCLARKILSEAEGTTWYGKQGNLLYWLSYLPNITVNYLVDLLRIFYKIRKLIFNKRFFQNSKKLPVKKRRWLSIGKKTSTGSAK